MKRVFGKVEVVFDGVYLLAAAGIGLWLVVRGSPLAGLMALTLSGGDAFHLLPRMRLILSGKEASLRRALGRGKQIASLTMTVFYVLLWHLSQPENGGWTALVYALAAVRLALCLLPQNRWQERFPPVSWGIWRNLPFFLLGTVVAARWFFCRALLPGTAQLWLAIGLSFACYLPVVLWSNQAPKIGMLMLPKTCLYLWMLTMFL